MPYLWSPTVVVLSDTAVQRAPLPSARYISPRALPPTTHTHIRGSIHHPPPFERCCRRCSKLETSSSRGLLARTDTKPLALFDVDYQSRIQIGKTLTLLLVRPAARTSKDTTTKKRVAEALGAARVWPERPAPTHPGSPGTNSDCARGGDRLLSRSALDVRVPRQGAS